VKKLSEKRRRFVEEYVACGEAKAAAIKAGYSRRSAKQLGERLTRDDQIRAEILKHTKAKSEEIGATRKDKRERLLQIIEGQDDKLSMQAIDIDNKMCAEYIQKHEVQHNFQNKSDDEVLADVIADLEARGYKVVPPK
jgi:phage terminase small subunit